MGPGNGKHYISDPLVHGSVGVTASRRVGSRVMGNDGVSCPGRSDPFLAESLMRRGLLAAGTVGSNVCHHNGWFRTHVTASNGPM